MAKRVYGSRTFRAGRMGLVIGILGLVGFAFYMTD